jgi:hypothetical protein
MGRGCRFYGDPSRRPFALTSSAPLGHFDEVEVFETPATRELEIVGELGVVVAVTEENGKQFFAIAIESLGRTVMLGLTRAGHGPPYRTRGDVRRVES